MSTVFMNNLPMLSGGIAFYTAHHQADLTLVELPEAWIQASSKFWWQTRQPTFFTPPSFIVPGTLVVLTLRFDYQKHVGALSGIFLAIVLPIERPQTQCLLYLLFSCVAAVPAAPREGKAVWTYEYVEGNIEPYLQTSLLYEIMRLPAVPPLVFTGGSGYITGKAQSLSRTTQVWLAARDIQLPGSNDNQAAAKHKPCLILMFFAAILGIEILLLVTATSISMDAALIVVLTMIILIYTCFTAKFIREIFHTAKRSVHRNAHGFLVYRYVQPEHKAGRFASTVMTCLLALVITVAAFLTGWTILITVILTTAVYTISRIVYVSISMRSVTIASLCCAALAILLAGVMASNSIQEPRSLELKSLLEDSWLAAYLSRKPLSFPLILALMSGKLIGMTYRFDYQRCANSSHTRQHVVVLSTVPAFGRDHGRGFIIPTNIPTGFSKPYFIAALTVWSVVRIIGLVVSNSFGYSDDFTSTVVMVGLEQPLICAILICFAGFRGEAKGRLVSQTHEGGDNLQVTIP
ncbi:hypothetical protein BU17DRAFT_67343 [Hysterangium stoloniferum]|nr:hypothetical protein BU17DRAFT_67343 [Hysterangium stoloniferum]